MGAFEDQETADLVRDATASPGKAIVFVIQNPLRSAESMANAIRKALEGQGAAFEIRTGETADGKPFVELTFLSRSSEPS